MVSTIYIARHGYRSNWVKDVPVPDPPTGIDGDPVLADHGVDQAEQLGAYLSGVEPPIHRIYSSPFYRCLQTAQPAAKLLALEINPETGVGEWFDDGRPTKPQPATPQQLKQFFPEVAENYQSVCPVSPTGESVDELHQRCIQAVTKLVEELQHEPAVQTILIVTHAATKIALGRALTGDKALEVRTGACSVDKFQRREAESSGMPGEWQMAMNGNTEFLRDGEEMHWSFDMAYAPGSTEDIASRAAQSEKENENHEEEVSVYIPLDMEHAKPTFNSTAQPTIQLVDFANDKPMVRVGETAYDVQFEKMVGTELYTEENGEYIAMSRERLRALPLHLRERNREEAGSDLNNVQKIKDKLAELTEQRKKQMAEEEKEEERRRQEQEQEQEQQQLEEQAEEQNDGEQMQMGHEQVPEPQSTNDVDIKMEEADA